jgi:acetoin utilization deacetylase AcuC-like enzyme
MTEKPKTQAELDEERLRDAIPVDAVTQELVGAGGGAGAGAGAGLGALGQTPMLVQSPNAGRGILAQAARHQLDGSCPIGPHTWLAAYWSAQSAVEAAAAVKTGERLAYALCRPPGHHARPGGAGLGYNLNLPMPHDSEEEEFFHQLELALAAIRQFQADALVLSLGFDIYQEDPQTKVAVSSQGFARLGQGIARLRLPTVIVQEGGYHLDSLGRNAGQFFAGLLNPLA